jgi:hypothetical protein
LQRDRPPTFFRLSHPVKVCADRHGARRVRQPILPIRVRLSRPPQFARDGRRRSGCPRARCLCTRATALNQHREALLVESTGRGRRNTAIFRSIVMVGAGGAWSLDTPLRRGCGRGLISEHPGAPMDLRDLPELLLGTIGVRRFISFGMKAIGMGSRLGGGPVATRTPDLNRVKVNAKSPYLTKWLAVQGAEWQGLQRLYLIELASSLAISARHSRSSSFSALPVLAVAPSGPRCQRVFTDSRP